MESVMLEHYYTKPSTIDRIRVSWLGSQIENYVGWMEANGYSSRTVFRRLPRLLCFADFARKRGCTDVESAVALVAGFVVTGFVVRDLWSDGNGTLLSAKLYPRSLATLLA